MIRGATAVSHTGLQLPEIIYNQINLFPHLPKEVLRVTFLVTITGGICLLKRNTDFWVFNLCVCVFNINSFYDGIWHRNVLQAHNLFLCKELLTTACYFMDIRKVQLQAAVPNVQLHLNKLQLFSSVPLLLPCIHII